MNPSFMNIEDEHKLVAESEYEIKISRNLVCDPFLGIFLFSKVGHGNFSAKLDRFAKKKKNIWNIFLLFFFLLF